MDADSSYGGSDTAQDYHSGHETNSLFETSHTDASHTHDQDKVTAAPVLTTQSPAEEINNQFYHRNEVTLPINYNENGYQSDESRFQPKEPHYLSTANLNINETLEHHSNLEEMNKQYKSTSHLNSESPTDMRRSNLGIDNLVFEDDVPDQMHVKSTFDSNKPYNGELHPSLALGINSPNHNEEPMTEAVNLELINLKPTGKDVTGPYENIGNGMTTIPLKRENDTEVGNPYDEYFVPVNEHRKYMRGEKLYVTMDKRGKKSKSKCLCWGICLLLVATALILGILAAVGVLANNKTPQEVSARNFDGSEPEIKKGSIFTASKVSNTEQPNSFTPETTSSTASNMPASTEPSTVQVGVTDNPGSSQGANSRDFDGTEPEVNQGRMFSSDVFNTEPPKPFTPAPPISTVSSMLPSTEMSMIQVPRALDSQLFIDNVQFNPELANKNSSEYSALATVLGKEIEELLFSRDILQYGPANIKVKVTDLTPEDDGGVVAKYRIIWKFKEGIHNPKDPIDETALESRMTQFLKQSTGLLGPYHVLQRPVTAERILDLCKIDNNGCEHVCLFDYDVMDFTCICPVGKILAENKKTCVDKSPRNSYVDYNIQQDQYVPSVEPIITTQPSTLVDSDKNAEYIQTAPYLLDFSAKTETTTTSESDDKNAEYNIHPSAYLDFSDKTETTTRTEPDVFPTLKQISQEDSPSTEPITKKSETTESEPIVHMKNNDYFSAILQTTTLPESDNPSGMDTTTITYNMAELSTNPLETTTVMEANPERLPVTAVPSAKTTLGTNAEVNKMNLAETTTELSQPTPEPTNPNADATSENSSKILIDLKPDPATEIILMRTTTTAPEEGTVTETHTTDISTHDLFSEDKLHELGVVRVVTPEAEIYTTTMESVPKFESVGTNKMNNRLTVESTTINGVTVNNSQLVMEESTTQLITSEMRKNQLQFVPVVINEDREVNDTEYSPMTPYPSTETPLNPQPKLLNDQTPKIYEITTQQAVSGVRPYPENSTERFADHMNVVEHSEHSPADYMSPFLPEIETDTFANTLHSDDHFNDNSLNSTHVENSTEDKTIPPNLENDQLNHTNPLDIQKNDTYLSVLPLEHENKENENELSGQYPTLQKESSNPVGIADIVTDKQDLGMVHFTEVESTTVSTDFTTTTANENDIFGTESDSLSVTETTLEPLATTHMDREEASTEMMITREKYMVTGLPPEIINNVHSNSYFENNSKILEEQFVTPGDRMTKELELTTQAQMTTTQVPLDTTKVNMDSLMKDDSSSSTEDLIASETTTNRFNISDENQTEEANSESNYLEQSTVNGEIIVTATETVNFETTEETTIMSTNEFTTSASAKLSNNYEVKETVADITTTEKLFVPVRPTANIIAIINQEDSEDLSIIPLEKEALNNTKLDKKRLVNEESFNQLEPNNNFNSISNEVHNPDTFPEDFNTKYVSDSVLDKNVTESNDTNSSTDIENKKQTLNEDNTAIFNKTVKQDILVLKDEDENLNTLKQEDKISQFDSVKPVTEDFALPRFSRCVVDQFPCLNGTSVKDGSYCIPSNDRCDSVHDCSDGSDEVNCTQEGCPNNFQCSSGQCLKRYLVCDGIINCSDGSDEVNCDKWSCNPDEISCGAGGRCIPRSWKCDGRSQCSDGSDEHHCHQYTCPNDAFHCAEQDTCIPLSWKCDGTNDCANGDDEKLCECTKEQFKCKLGGGCINVEEVCDGTEQCADKSDEWNCVRLEELENNLDTKQKNILQVRHKNNTWYPVCMDWGIWNTTYADKVCQSMGFAGATLLESIPKTEAYQANGYYKLVTPSRAASGLSILSQLKKTEQNECDQLVSITCQEFVCGDPMSVNVSSDIIGNKTGATESPILGLIYDKKHNTYCTATILTPLWAVASYSCMVAVTRTVDTKDWTLSAGINSYANQVGNSSGQTRQIRQIIPHPQAKFSRFEFTNDVILIQLSQPLTLNKNVSVICLPSEDLTKDLCVTAGWKANKPGEPFKQQYIHTQLGPIMDSEECNSTEYYNGMITEDKICATTDDTRCYDDAGAPLMCVSEAGNIWELHGIQSHQENVMCDESTHPATYSAVNQKLRSWITNTIGKKALTRNL